MAGSCSASNELGGNGEVSNYACDDVNHLFATSKR